MNTSWSDFLQKQAALSALDFTTATPENKFTLINSLSAIRVSGKEAPSFLQGQLTCDVNRLSPTQALPGGLCTPKGRLVATLIIIKLADVFLLILPKDMLAITLKRLKKYAIFSKVTAIEDQGHFLFREDQAAPPHAYAIERQEHLITLTYPQSPCCVLHYAQNEEVLLKQITGLSTLCHAPETIWNYHNITKKLANITSNTIALFTPQMLALEKYDGVSFEKGCYLGQEIVARTQHLGKLKRHLFSFSCRTSSPVDAGELVYDEQKNSVGTVIDSVAINMQEALGLAVIEDRATSGKLFINTQAIQLRE